MAKYINILVRLILFILLIALFFSCSKPKRQRVYISTKQKADTQIAKSQTTSQSSVSKEKKHSKTLTFGLTPQSNNEKMKADYSPLAKYLSENYRLI